VSGRPRELGNGFQLQGGTPTFVCEDSPYIGRDSWHEKGVSLKRLLARFLFSFPLLLFLVGFLWYYCFFLGLVSFRLGLLFGGVSLGVVFRQFDHLRSGLAGGKSFSLRMVSALG
jgi:hypothetical protein